MQFTENCPNKTTVHNASPQILINQYMLHLIPTKRPSPLRSAHGANKGRLNKETWKTTSAAGLVKDPQDVF